MSIKLKRGTRAAINAQATQGLLQAGEPLFITDESRFAVATSATQYTDMAKRDDSPIFFSAFLNAGQTPAIDQPFTSWTVAVNVGGGTYLATDGSYTVPKTGWYRIYASLLKQNVANAGGIRARINGSNQNRIAFADSAGTASYDMATGEDFHYIQAGHKVQLININGIAWFGAPSPDTVGRWIVEFKTASAT